MVANPLLKWKHTQTILDSTFSCSWDIFLMYSLMLDCSRTIIHNISPTKYKCVFTINYYFLQLQTIMFDRILTHRHYPCNCLWKLWDFHWSQSLHGPSIASVCKIVVDSEDLSITPLLCHTWWLALVLTHCLSLSSAVWLSCFICAVGLNVCRYLRS